MQLELSSPTDFETWRTQARWLAAHDVAAESVHWRVAGEASLLDEPPATLGPADEGAALRVPRAFVDLARTVILHRDPARFALLYRVLLRLRQEPRLLDVSVDADVARLLALERQVRHDQHRMHAYVRFRRLFDDDGERYVAWYAPEHHIVDSVADFFVRRFAGQRWAILTPERSLLWDLSQLSFGPGLPRSAAPDEDALEALWRCYYAASFNPARANPAALAGHMPRKFWSLLPEAQLISPLLAQAAARTGQMVAAAPGPARRQRTSPLPTRMTTTGPAQDTDDRDLAALSTRLADCRECPLWQHATQPVAGEGPADAALMLVGEQPGDAEDIAGRPFVGPAGQLLDRALQEAGIDRDAVYVTNAVKHFKYELRQTPRGRRRLHKSPAEREIAACSRWLRHELAAVKAPRVVALGASAARALLGHEVKVDSLRGRWLALDDQRVLMVTVHPAWLLRIPPAQFDAQYARFVADLRQTQSQAVPR